VVLSVCELGSMLIHQWVSFLCTVHVLDCPCMWCFTIHMTSVLWFLISATYFHKWNIMKVKSHTLNLKYCKYVYIEAPKHLVFRPDGCGRGCNFAPAPDPHRDGFGRGLVLHPRVTRRVLKKSLAIFFTRHPSSPAQLGAHLNAHAQVSLCILWLLFVSNF
jgi:hypothetical protein